VADAAGLTTARYRNGDVDDMKRSVRTACIEIKERIALEGVFQDRLAE
jgi:CRP/FNR family transcriptional regulator, cyclic AMP receptor protein